jgi:hypothetical protein
MKASLITLSVITLFFLGASLFVSIAYHKWLNKQKRLGLIPANTLIESAPVSFTGAEDSFLSKKPFLKPIMMDPGVSDPDPF